MKTVLRNSILFVGLITLMTMISSCYKEKSTTAVVTVLDVANAPVPGASVKLYYKYASDSLGTDLRLDKTQTTDASGKATFDYTDEFKSGQAGLSVHEQGRAGRWQPVARLVLAGAAGTFLSRGRRFRCRQEGVRPQELQRGFRANR